MCVVLCKTKKTVRTCIFFFFSIIKDKMMENIVAFRFILKPWTGCRRPAGLEKNNHTVRVSVFVTGGGGPHSLSTQNYHFILPIYSRLLPVER